LRKLKGSVDDLASVVRQEFDIVEGSQGPQHSERGWAGVVGAPLRLTVQGQ